MQKFLSRPAVHQPGDMTQSTENVGHWDLQMPPEILEQIFLFCLGPRRQAVMHPASQKSAPLFVSQICRYWRDVALSLPALWSTFHPGTSLTPNNVSMIKVFLERSKNHPLSLTFPRGGKSKPVLDLFYAHMHRWREILIDTEVELVSKLTSLQSQAIPQLETIVFRHSHRNSDVDSLCSVLASLSSLRRIDWTEEGHLPRTFINISWPNIRCFVIHAAIRADECYWLLSHSPRVEKITIRRYRESSINLSSLVTVTLPYLVKLFLNGDKLSDTGKLLDLLCLPSLQSLDMKPPRDHATLARLGARSGCNLTHLGLFDETISPIAIPVYDPLVYITTPCVETIRSLYIGQAVTESFIRRLTWNPAENSSHHLPHLVEISGMYYHATDGLVSRMIASRWNRHRKGREPARLAFAKLHCPLAISTKANESVGSFAKDSCDQDEIALREMAEQGLEIEFFPDWAWKSVI